jgi:hypothetical protein
MSPGDLVRAKVRKSRGASDAFLSAKLEPGPVGICQVKAKAILLVIATTVYCHEKFCLVTDGNVVGWRPQAQLLNIVRSDVAEH